MHSDCVSDFYVTTFIWKSLCISFGCENSGLPKCCHFHLSVCVCVQAYYKMIFNVSVLIHCRCRLDTEGSERTNV